jgi:hypothetical protein
VEIHKFFSALGANALNKRANCFALMNDGTEIIFIENVNYLKRITAQ